MLDAIVARDLRYTYTGGFEALRGINVGISEGEFLAIVGQNGSGKTTLAKHFNGLLKATSGTVSVYGEDASTAGVAKLSSVVGYVFQNPDHMLFANSVEEEVGFGPRNLGLDATEIEGRVKSALDVTNLSRHRKDSPFFFGKGVRRKITLAAALAMNPKVFVIDEPTIGMDYRSSVEVMNLLKEIHGRGHTIIVIMHDMRMVADYTNRAIVVSDGKILFDGPTRELFTHDEILKNASLRPPQITRLAQKLGALGIPLDVLTVDELHERLKPLGFKRG